MCSTTRRSPDACWSFGRLQPRPSRRRKSNVGAPARNTRHDRSRSLWERAHLKVGSRPKVTRKLVHRKVCSSGKCRSSAQVLNVPILFSNGSRGSPPILSDLRSQRVSAFSTCSRALDGVSWGGATWLKPQSAVLPGRMRQNRRHHPHPPLGVAPLGSSSRPVFRCSS